MIQIKNKMHVQLFVQTFYSEVRKDELIGPIFEARIHGDWAPHLSKMSSFWNTVLFGQMDYKGNPFQPHAHLPIDQQHFERWLELLKKVVKTHFEGEKANEILWRADKMAILFQRKLAHQKGSNFKSII